MIFLKYFFPNFCSHIKDPKWGRKFILLIVQAVMEVLNKSRYSNSHLQMRQNPISVAEHSGHCEINFVKLSLCKTCIR